MSEKLDVIIFGATGFTGKYTVFEGIKILSTLKWGIAGRSKEKLEAVLVEMGKKGATDLSKTPIFIADVNNEESLQKMAEGCKIVVNCCGPYRFYGEPVIKACINAGTHHVDVSGEPQYMERMQLEYNDLAAQKGVYVISACGFDSIPADMGTIFLEQTFDGEVNSVETYLHSWEEGGASTGGASIHYGTWESAVYGLAHANELRGLRTKLYKERLPKMMPTLKSRAAIHKSLFTNTYCLPFPGSDRSVVMRSQRYFYDHEKKRPIQMKAYFAVESFLSIIGMMIFGGMFLILTRFKFGRSILLSYPRFFSGGYISHEGPSEEKMSKTKFAMTFVGEGWPKDESLAEASDSHTDPPTKKLITKVSGSNPGYGATCVALLLAATTTLNESSKMPGTGGVFPPGAAFAKTNLISELSKNGYKFEVISGKETTKSDE